MDLAAVDAHRGEINAVTALAQQDLGSYTQSILNEPPERVAAQLRVATPAVAETYGGVAATSGALFYETQRPRPGWSGRLASPTIADTIASQLGWALVPIFKPDVFVDPGVEMLGRVFGLTQKLVALYDRETINLNSSLDPTSGGVKRYARAGACAFCAYLTTIDAHVTEATVWHDRCKCVTVPWWDDNPLPANPKMDEWAEAAQSARAAIEQDYLAKRRLDPGLKRRDFFRKYPETAKNQKNIAAYMRSSLGLAH